MGLKLREFQLFSIVLQIVVGHLTRAEIYKLPLRRARSNALHQGSRKLPYDVDLNGKPGQGYYTQVEIGTPPQKINILVDTGSSNFAVAAAANKDVVKYFHTESSSSFVNQGKDVSVLYTQGNWKGHLGTDVISMPMLPKINQIRTDIALITSSSNFFINGSGWQGIFGLAFSDIARPDSSVTPFFDTLVKEAGIPNEFSMLLCGTIDTPNKTDASMGGTLVIGGADPSLYIGHIYYTSIRQEWYYEVIITDIGVENTSLGMDCVKYNIDKTIVDSGTTNLRLPEPAFNRTVAEIKSRTWISIENPDFWDGLSVMCWDEGMVPFSSFPDIYLDLAEDGSNDESSVRLAITPQQYLRAVGDDVDITPDKDCFKFSIAYSVQGSVIGAVIMEGYYVHFDRANKRIGFAKSSCAVRDELYRAGVSGGHNFSAGNTSVCGYIKPPQPLSSLQIVAFIMAGISVACLLPLAALVSHWLYKKQRKGMCQKNSQSMAENGEDDAGLMDSIHGNEEHTDDSP